MPAWAARGFNPHHRKASSYYPLLAHLAQTQGALPLLQFTASKLWDARDQAIVRGKYEAGFRFTEVHHRARPIARRKAAAVNNDFSAGNCRSGGNPINTGKPVFFHRRAKSKFHTRLKCNASRRRIAA